MRKWTYGIGVFLFLGALSLAYCESYRIADSRDRAWLLEQAEAGQTVDAGGEAGEYGLYYLKEQDGYVLVCLSDKETVYETTSISLSTLPKALKTEIQNGKYLKDQQELYSFLENYSS